MYPQSAAATALRGAGVAVYDAVEQACFALARLVEHGIAPTETVPSLPEPASAATGDGYGAARALLAAAGIAFVEQRTAR